MAFLWAVIFPGHSCLAPWVRCLIQNGTESATRIFTLKTEMKEVLFICAKTTGAGGGRGKQGNDKGRREGRRKEKRGGGRRENTDYLVND